MTTFGEWRRGHDTKVQALSIPESARVFQGERAGFTTRILACAVDVALVAAFMMGVWVTLWLVQLILTPGVDVQPPAASTLVLWGYLFMTLYWSFTWSTSGRSLGAWLLGVRVVNSKGNRLRWPYALLRAAFCVGFPFGLLWALVSKRNRSVQDAVLRTIVIYDWYVSPSVLIGVVRQS